MATLKFVYDITSWFWFLVEALKSYLDMCGANEKYVWKCRHFLLTSQLDGPFSFAHVVGGKASVVGEVLNADTVDDELVLVRTMGWRNDLSILAQKVHSQFNYGYFKLHILLFCPSVYPQLIQLQSYG